MQIPAQHSSIAVLAILFFTCGINALRGEVIVNEIVASNRSGAEDENGQLDDWIELRNLASEPIDLGDMYLTDSLEAPEQWQIPQGTVIDGLSYLLIWADGHSAQGTNHASFALSRGGGTVALIDRDGSSVLDRIDYSEQSPDISLGRTLDTTENTLVFFPTPTPGQPNITLSVPILASVAMSTPGGFFIESLEINLTTPLAGADIRYTLDGNQPTSESAVFSQPIAITETSALTAAVFSGDRRIGPVASEVYLAVGDDLANFSSNLPIAVVDSRGYRFSRDSSLNRDFPPELVYSVFKIPDTNGRGGLLGATDYAGRAGMNVRGASSREWPKKSYKLETWDAMDGNNNVSLLGFPEENDWILHGPYFDKTFMRNFLTYLWWERLGHYSVRTQFIELFVNQDGDPEIEMEDYVGVYLLMEKIKAGPDRVDVLSLQPFDGEEPAISGGYVLQTTNIQQHFKSRRGVSMKYVSPRLEELTSAQKTWIRDYINDMESVLFKRDVAELSDPIEGYSKWIDVPSHIDYDIMRELTRNIDGASTYMSIDRGGKLKMGPLWDYNQSLGMTSLFSGEFGWETDGWNNVYMRQTGHWAKWWDKLDADPDYQTRWFDRWIELRSGILSTERLAADIDAAEELLAEAQQRNYERWEVLGESVWVTGSPREAPGFAERDTYAKEVAWMRGWLVERLNWIDSQVPAPPDFQPAQSALEVGTAVTIAHGAGAQFDILKGTLYFTQDGTDPRLPGGAVNPNAAEFSNPLPLLESSTIHSRVRAENGEWSSLGVARYLVGTQMPSPGDLVITEIHYNPLESQKLEFFEVTNRSTDILNLSDIAIADAVAFSFPLMQLEPGASVVLVADEPAFRAYYGESATIAGAWDGQLSNGGETITLKNANGQTLAAVAYDDSPPWPTAADGFGSSLELSQIDANAIDPTAWSASRSSGGNPGRFSAAITYAEWAAGAITNQDLNAPTDDADSDGASNFLEFALASNPLSPSSMPALNAKSDNEILKVTFRRRVGTSVDFLCEQSIDLETWSTPPGGCEEISAVAVDADATSAIEEVTLQLNNAGSYIRIAVSETIRP